MSDTDSLLITATPELNARVGAWLDHLGDERRLADKTLVAYERDVRQFLRFLTGHLGGAPDLKDVQELKPADFRAFMARRRTGGTGSRSLARGLAGIRSFLGFLERQGEVNAAAAGAVRAPRQPRSLPKPLTASDATAVASGELAMESEAWIEARNAAVLTLLYGCGLRISEALSITGRNAPRTGTRSLRIMGKGGKERVVPVLPVVCEAVEAYLKLCPYTPEPNGPLFFGARGGAQSAPYPACHGQTARSTRPAGQRHTACPAPLLRDPPSCRRRGPAYNSGAFGPRQPFHHPDLYGSGCGEIA